MTKPYNPSAFPSPGIVFPSGLQQGAYEGMTLRDYFAAHAPERPAWFERICVGGSHYEDLMVCNARWRYHYADSMLRQREVG